MENNPKRPRLFSFQKAAEVRRTLIERTDRLYREAEEFYLTRTAIRERYQAEVVLHTGYERLRYSDRDYLLGYRAALDKLLWSKMVWLKSIDGNLYTTKEVDAITNMERALGYQHQKSDYREPWSRVDNEKSIHVYADKHGTPLRDKPAL